MLSVFFPQKYVSIIRDIYKMVVMNVRTCGGLIDEFLITIWVHQGSTLTPFLFAIIMHEITKDIKMILYWLMRLKKGLIQN